VCNLIIKYSNIIIVLLLLLITSYLTNVFTININILALKHYVVNLIFAVILGPLFAKCISSK